MPTATASCSKGEALREIVLMLSWLSFWTRGTWKCNSGIEWHPHPWQWSWCSSAIVLNDDDCDKKNKIKTKHFSEGLSSHVAVWSSAKRNRVPWTFCIFNFLEKKNLIKINFMSQEKWEYRGCAYIIILERNSIPQLGPGMGISFGILMVVFLSLCWQAELKWCPRSCMWAVSSLKLNRMSLEIVEFVCAVCSWQDVCGS